jgi:phosphoheptose isomerase
VNRDLADDLATASLALARRFDAGATLWCCAPSWPSDARHVAVEFVHPVIVGKRSLPSVAVPAGADPTAVLRASTRPGDVLLAIGGAADPALVDVVRRCPAWGVETLWLGAGQAPAAGAADHVLWLDGDDPDEVPQQVVRAYHLLWELTHVCFEQPGALAAPADASAGGGSTCVTCADEGRLAEVESVDGAEAVVRTAAGRERVDTTLVAGAAPGDLLVVHAGTAITACDAAGAA